MLYSQSHSDIPEFNLKQPLQQEIALIQVDREDDVLTTFLRSENQVSLLSIAFCCLHNLKPSMIVIESRIKHLFQDVKRRNPFIRSNIFMTIVFILLLNSLYSPPLHGESVELEVSIGQLWLFTHKSGKIAACTMAQFIPFELVASSRFQGNF